MTSTVIIDNLICNDTMSCPNMTLDGSDVISENSSSVLTNKTINSSTNDILISSSPLSDENINNILNQPLKIDSQPVFARGSIVNSDNIVNKPNLLTVRNSELTKPCNLLTLDGPNLSTMNYKVRTNPSNPAANQFFSNYYSENDLIGSIAFSKSSVNTNCEIYSAGDINLAFNNGFLQLPGAGLSVNNNGSILATNLGIMCLRDDIPSLTSSSILTNKTIDSANNTVRVNGTNINSLINQPLLSTSNVSFNMISQGLGSTIINRNSPITASIAGGGFTDVVSTVTASNTSGVIQLRLSANGVNGAVADYGYADYDYSFKFINFSGTVDMTAGVDANKSERNVGTGGFTNKITFAPIVTGTTVAVRISNTGTFPIRLFGYYIVIYL